MKTFYNRSFVLFFVFPGIFLSAQIYGQVPHEKIMLAAQNFTTEVFPDGQRNVAQIIPWTQDGVTTIYALNLQPDGWLLMSGDLSTEPVIGFSYERKFEIPEPDVNNPAFNWFNGVHKHIKEDFQDKKIINHPGWQRLLSSEKSVSHSTSLTIDPLIQAKWNQNSGWNQFCPADPAGPGGHSYVGCVAVSMVQAMTVFNYPVTGKGKYTYNHQKYGVQSVNLGQAVYHWDSMSNSSPNVQSAKILYHAGVSVSMDFSAQGSGTQTMFAAGALRNYFKYSKNTIYMTRSSVANNEIWMDLINNELINGRTVIYAGNANDGRPGHAFNLDGVQVIPGINTYYHINWGWGGTNDGLFLIDNLKIGNQDFSKNHAAIFGIQPLYYPTAINLSANEVVVNSPTGSLVGTISVVDEATDNRYFFSHSSDSVYGDEGWIPNYYIEEGELRTNRVFSQHDPETDTIVIHLTDIENNFIEARFAINIVSYSGSTGINQHIFRSDLIYPNPVHDILFVNENLSINFSGVRIFDISGKLVRVAGKNEISPGLDVSFLHDGVYFIQVMDGVNPISYGKFIKTR